MLENITNRQYPYPEVPETIRRKFAAQQVMDLFNARLASINPGKVEIEDHEVRTRRVGVRSLTMQECHRDLTVFRDMELVVHLSGAKGLRRQSHIARVVLYEQDLDRVTL